MAPGVVTSNRYGNLGSLFFDGVCLSWVGLAVSGGIPYHGHLYLKHGADSRRVVILLVLLGYACMKSFRQTSWVLWGVRQVGHLLSQQRFRWSVYCVCCLAAIRLAILQTLAMRVPLWDVGIFHQILWSLAHGLGFHSTISGAGDFLGDHFAPSLALLVPLFELFGETPLFLPVIQVLLIFGGGAAWIFLAERAGQATFGDELNPLAAATTVFVLSFDSLWKNLRWGFHENAIAFCALSWAMALLLSSALGGRPAVKKGLITVLFLVAAGSKEILLLDIGLGFLVWGGQDLLGRHKGRSPVGLAIAKLSVALVLGLGFVLFETMAHPPDKNYFNRYYAYLGSNLSEFLTNVLFAPGRVLGAVGLKAMLRYFWVVFLPWLFLLPVFGLRVFTNLRGRKLRFSLAPDTPWLLMIVPSFASAALASFPPLRDPGFHYVLELWPVLACVTIQALARQRSGLTAGGAGLAWGWALMSLLALDFDPVAEYREYRSQQVGRSELIQLIGKIPPEAAVMADELAGTWISGRRWATRWPDTRLLPLDCPGYILIEEPTPEREKEVQALFSRCGGPRGERIAQATIQRAGGWVLYRVQDHVFL